MADEKDLLSGTEGGEVTLPEPADRDDDQGAAPPAQPGMRPTAGNQNGGRSGSFRKLAQEFESFRNDGIKRHIESATAPLQQSIAELRQLLSQSRAAPAAAPQAGAGGQSDSEKGLIREMNSLVSEARQATTPERLAQITARHGELQAELRKVQDAALTERILKEAAEKFGNRRDEQVGDPVVRRAYEMIETDYPELLTGTNDDINKAMRKVRAYVDHEVEVEERPRTVALFKEAAAHVRAKLGKGEIPAPVRDRQTLSSPARGQGGGGTQRNGTGIKMPKAMLRAAMNAVPGMTPADLARRIAEQPDD